MKLRAIRNRDDDFVICHDQLCKKGETSIVAHVWVSGPHADQIEKQFNAPQFSFEELDLIGKAMHNWPRHGWEPTHTAVVEKVRVACSNLPRDQLIRETV